MLSSATVLFRPKLSVQFNKASTPLPPRVTLRPPLASAATATARNTASTSTTSFPSSRPMASLSCASLYEVLGIPTGASCEEVKAAYRRLARICHPDVAAMDRKESSADEFIRIHAAYCTLSDPDKRAVYDQKLFRRRRRPLTAAPPSGYSGYSGRAWETDQCW